MEVFYADAGQLAPNDDGEPAEPGWYWHACFPNCAPESEPFGPFPTDTAALAAARSFYAE